MSNPITTDHLGNTYPSQNAMCRKWNVHPGTFCSRRAKGWTVEEALTGSRPKLTEKACVDHTGRKFPSVVAMCRHWGVAPCKFHNRRLIGWTLEEALTGNRIRPNWKPSEDHLGNTFHSRTAMCEAWGVSISLYTSRIHQGWTVEEALTGINHHPTKKTA